MKRVLIEVEIPEEPDVMDPATLMEQLGRWAEHYGAKVLQARTYDKRDKDKPKEAK